jgi:hypothetical protein
VTQTAPPKESVLLANEGHFISGDILKRLAPDFDGGHPMGKSSKKMNTLPSAIISMFRVNTPVVNIVILPFFERMCPKTMTRLKSSSTMQDHGAQIEQSENLELIRVTPVA